MLKSEYMRRLAAALKTVERTERDKYLAYYSELIDDRMEEGLSEEEAVAGLENVNQAASRILNEAREQGKIRTGMSGGAIAAIVIGSLLFLSFVAYTLSSLFGYVSFGFFNYRNSGTLELDVVETNFPVEYKLHEESFSADTISVELGLIVSYVEVKPSPDSEFHLTYYTSADYPLQFISSVSSGGVRLEDTRTRQYSSVQLSDLFSSRYSKSKEHTVTLLIPENASGRLELATVSGDVMLYGVAMENSLDIASVSGDISVDTIDFRNVNIASVSGNMDIASLVTNGVFLATTSGDVELGNVTTGKINAASVSGNIRLYNTSFDTLEVGTVSGDLEGTLLGSPSDYRVDFTSLSGSNSLGSSKGGSKKIEFASVSGDLNLDFEN